MKATTIWTITTMSKDSKLLKCVSEASANAPDTELTANHPIPDANQLASDGNAFPIFPKAARLTTSCGTPYLGPSWVRTY